VSTPADPSQTLARRLKALREHGLSGRTITQRQLAEAFSAEEKASGPLISSWENGSIPPANRIEAYATFFATEQSVASHPPRILSISELTPEEIGLRNELLSELTELRNSAIKFASTSTESLWHFSADQDITIICAELPKEMWPNLPYADPDSPDYVKLSRISDLDALVELHGHVRAINSANSVRISTPAQATSDMFSTHLVVIGGVDWNRVTRDIFRLVEAPVRQAPRDLPTDIGGFEVGEGSNIQTFKPIIREVGNKVELVEDVAHFYRSPNPYNAKRTVTLCNGMYGRGVYGAVRALTDSKFRDRNEEYIRRNLNPERFSIVSRVLIASGEVVTPDWTRRGIRLHEWPKEPSELPDTHA
jgi:hypothetical protein